MGALTGHFRDAPERRVQIIMYMMLGLLVYFVLDLGMTRAADRTETLKEELGLIQEDIESRSALIDQTHFVQAELDKLKQESEHLRISREERVTELLHCREQILLDVLHGGRNEQNPLQGIRLREDSFPGALAQYLYQVDVSGGYPDVMALLERLDQSPCGMHVTRWLLAADDSNGGSLTGSLFLRLYRAGEAK